jgi:hypothetical protein
MGFDFDVVIVGPASPVRPARCRGAAHCGSAVLERKRDLKLRTPASNKNTERTLLHRPRGLTWRIEAVRLYAPA